MATKEKVSKFFLTKKDYKPKVLHTAAAWEIVKKAIGNKGATRDELVHALNYSDKAWAAATTQEGWKWKKQDHKCFIGYMVKLGNIAAKSV